MRNIVTPIHSAAALGILLGCAATARGQENAPAVPSGIPLTLHEILLEPQPDASLWVRFRYVAATLSDRPFAEIETDFPELCAKQVLPWVATYDSGGAKVAQAVISMASQPLEFGTSDPDVTQYFEVYRLENGSCIWEAF